MGKRTKKRAPAPPERNDETPAPPADEGNDHPAPGEFLHGPDDAAEPAGAFGGLAPVPPAGPLHPRTERPGPLASYDTLGAYLREIGRYALLTTEEEHALAVRYYRDQDVDAAARLVTSNLRLVVKIASEYRWAFSNLMDLIQEGNIGLMQAVKKFNPYRGVKLSTYSAWWIRAYILRYALNNWRLVKIGTTQAQRRLFFNLSKEKRRFEAMGIDPTPARIAEALHVTPEEASEMQLRLAAPETPLDAPARGPSSPDSDRRMSARIDLVGDESVGADEALALARLNETLHAKVAAFAETLAGREADVFRNRLWADQPETLQQIGDRHGMTREGVRQIEKKILKRLRLWLESEMGEYLEFR
ncbi:MAG: RNA polymerase factor sigma-32 [Myxococcota bacterium]|nr:RNA polymerase factor sigma-32 [Myxococcota bacterium]